MNESKKLSLSKETLRCLDDQELTDVVGGGCGGGGGGFSNVCQSDAVICISNAGNSCVCVQSVVLCL